MLLLVKCYDKIWLSHPSTESSLHLLSLRWLTSNNKKFLLRNRHSLYFILTYLCCKIPTFVSSLSIAAQKFNDFFFLKRHFIFFCSIFHFSISVGATFWHYSPQKVHQRFFFYIIRPPDQKNLFKKVFFPFLIRVLKYILYSPHIPNSYIDRVPYFHQ